MPWVNLDDQMPDHPKNVALSDAAFRLAVSALCYCNRLRTDGFVPVAAVQRLVPKFKRSSLTELLHSGIWEPADGGYTVHDYLDWNQSREQIERRRQRKSEAGKKGMAVRWGKTA